MMDRIKAIRKNKPVLAVLFVLVAAVISFIAFGGSETKHAAATTGDGGGALAGDISQEGGLAAYDKDGDGVVYQDGMHPWIVLDAPGPSPDCGMALTPVQVDQNQEAGVVRIDPVTIQSIGVRTAPVNIEALGRTVRTTGRFVMNEQGEHTVSLKVSGWIEKLYADYDGELVHTGQPLLELYSPELVSTQEEYLLALQNTRRMEDGFGAEDAQRLLEAARRRLIYWDLSPAQIQHLEQTGKPQRTLTFYAPTSGEVMNKQVAEGQFVEAGQALMDIVDITKNWLIVDVYEQDMSWVKVGTRARIELPYHPGQVYNGRVSYIYHMLNPETRSARARIVLPGGHNAPIRPGMYATVHLIGGDAEPMPVVPTEALLRTGEEELVILALGEGRFRPQRVVAGTQSNGKVQILDGLQEGQEVVTSAQFLIDSEARLQSAIGAMVGGTHSGSTGHLGSDEHDQVSPPTDRPDPQLADTAQVVPVTVGASGFKPLEIELAAGIPARLVFTRTADSTCATQVQVPAFGKTIDLPLNKAVALEFTPDEPGTFTFACGMDMLKGMLIVTS